MTDSCSLVVPMDSAAGNVTQLLRRLADGDKTAGEELAPQVYSELHKLAASYLRRERPSHTWQTTDLVNEAYLKLAGNPGPNFQGRSHFFGVAAQIMRRILTDYARRNQAEKRGGSALVLPFEEGLVIAEEQCGLIADLDEALQRLEAIDARAAHVVELRFFGGLTEEEIAEVLGVSSRTVKRCWMTARAWLLDQLSPHPE
jgi:RNA polymerase sigma-70 factor (ECF subfamily)